VVLLQNRCVLRKQSLLLLFHNGRLVSLFGNLSVALGQFDCALLSEDGQLLLPQALDLAAVLLLAHTALLLSHLLEPFVFGELGEQLLFEVLLKALFFGGTFGLQTHLEVFGLLKLSLRLLFLGNGIGLALASSEFILLVVKLIAEVLAELSLLSASHLLSLKLFENGVARGLSLILGGLNLVEALLLLLSVLANHLVFIRFHLLLATDQSSLLIHGEDHVGLSLLHFQVLDAGHLSVLADHALDNGIDLVTFLQVLSLSFGLNFSALLDLVLHRVLVI
jgi:hypothetical protein